MRLKKEDDRDKPSFAFLRPPHLLLNLLLKTSPPTWRNSAQQSGWPFLNQLSLVKLRISFHKIFPLVTVIK